MALTEKEALFDTDPQDGVLSPSERQMFNSVGGFIDIDAINEGVKLKYTDNDILDVLDGIAGPTLKSMIMSRLNDVWNTKNGVV